MEICSDCREVLRPVRTGVVVLWGKDHARAGDEYECPNCGTKTISANDESYVASRLELQHAESSGRLRRMV